jgi:hypothetical protein
VNREEQLQWEREKARPAAIAAFLSAVLLLGGTLYLQSAVTGNVSDNADQLVVIHKHPGATIAGIGLRSLSLILMAPALYYLFRATRFRRPQLPAALVYAIVIAPVVLGIAAFVYEVKLVSVANQFNKLPPMVPKEAVSKADHLVGTGLLTAAGGIQTAAVLGTVIAIIMLSLNAMRAGLFSRFMGIFGIIVGVLFVLPLSSLPIVQVFWLAALGVLYIGSWPQGRGPAWDSGEAIPWPTAQQKREALQGTAREPGARGAPTRRPSTNGAGTEEAEEPVATTTVDRPRASEHSRSKKRKRKRRG